MHIINSPLVTVSDEIIVIRGMSKCLQQIRAIPECVVNLSLKL